MPNTEAQICVYDLTFSFDKNPEQDSLKSFFKTYCKKWVYQLEQGDTTGYKHWQCRVNLNKKERKTGLFKALTDNNLIIHKDAIRPTSANSTKDEVFFNYCSKDHTRIDGPWTSKDKPPTKQMMMFNKWGLRPWQQSLEEISTTFDLRTIDLIYDVNGNNGKSLFSEYLESKDIAEEVPPYRMMDHIFEWVCSRPIKQCYIFDMPRGMKKDKLADFYAGIEVIKNGVAYDKRYTATKIRFDRPRVFVFTNTLPEFSLMSKDRWKVWTLHDDLLKPFMIDDELWLSDDD